ncbi:MAG: TolC family protein [Chryseolinea sp.]
MRSKKFLLLGLLVCSFCVSLGQDKVVKLSFKEAVRLGIENNVTVNQERNQLEYTQVNKTSSLLQLGPSVYGQGNVYRTDGNTFNPNDLTVVNGIFDYVGGSINANMPLFSGFTFMNQFRAASSNNEAQLHKVVRSNQDVIAKVSSQYLQCLLDQQLVKVNEENVRVQKVTYDQIKEQADLGAKAEGDVYNQEYLWRNAELALVQSRNKLKNDIAALSITLQTDPGVYIEVDQVDWDINMLIADSTTYDVMVSTAIDRRSDLKQAGYAEKGARASYSARKGYYFPSIYAGVSYGSRYNYVKGEDNRSFKDQFTKDNIALSYGLSINIPIFNSFTYRAQTALARVNYNNATLAKKNAEVTVKSDVVLAYQNFNDAKTTYFTSQAQLKASEFAYNMEKERYDLGISNIVQLSTVSQAYVRAQGDFQTATYTLMFQKILISYAMGTLQVEDIP